MPAVGFSWADAFFNQMDPKRRNRYTVLIETAYF